MEDKKGFDYKNFHPSRQCGKKYKENRKIVIVEKNYFLIWRVDKVNQSAPFFATGRISNPDVWPLGNKNLKL